MPDRNTFDTSLARIWSDDTDSNGRAFELAESFWEKSALVNEHRDSVLFSRNAFADINAQIDASPLFSDSGLFPRFSDLVNPSAPTDPVPPPSSEPASEHTDDKLFSEPSDIWLDPASSLPLSPPRFCTWDSFLGFPSDEKTPYLSETSSRVFDAALEASTDPSITIREEVFTTCLFHLSLGRSSVLFLYDRLSGSFKPIRERMRVSGCTAEAMESLIERFASCGRNIKSLQRFTDSVHVNSAASPSLVALAEVVATVVEAVTKRLLERKDTNSILALHECVREPALIVEAFVSLSAAADGVEGEAELLTRVFDVVEQLQHRMGWLKPLLMEALAMISRPWVDFVKYWIGLERVYSLPPETGLFVKKQGKEWVFEAERIPGFLTQEFAEGIFEAGKSLRFLEKWHPDHPLARGKKQGPKMEWVFEWKDLARVQKAAQDYEAMLKSALESFERNESRETEQSEREEEKGVQPRSIFTLGADEVVTHFETQIQSLSNPISPSTSKLGDLVSSLTTDAKSLTTFSPPLSTTPLLSFSSLTSVQSRFINKTTLHYFTTSHPLLSHLSFLYRLLLITDPFFSQRLSHALFSSSTENRALSLGSRTKWPPASSELRLALTDVLKDSLSGMSTNPFGFSIRAMNPAESDKILDPSSLSALDFLTLTYTPPDPLGLVITPTALALYDRVFAQQLRFLRLLYVINDIFFNELRGRTGGQEWGLTYRFAFEGRIFVNAVCAYFQDAISGPWRSFIASIPHAHGIDGIRRLHETTLERIMYGCVLKHRQIQISETLESALSRILEFAKLLRGRSQDAETSWDGEGGGGFGGGEDMERWEEMQACNQAFRKSVRSFLVICRGLVDKKMYVAYGEAGGFAGLVQRLEMSGYWSEKDDK